MVSICENTLCMKPAKYLVKKKNCPNDFMYCCVYNVCISHYYSDHHKIVTTYCSKLVSNRNIKKIIKELRSW